MTDLQEAVKKSEEIGRNKKEGGEQGVGKERDLRDRNKRGELNITPSVGYQGGCIFSSSRLWKVSRSRRILRFWI